MGAERKVMQEYIDALVKRADYPAYFTDDVVATFEGTDQRAVGREAAGQLIRYVHEGAFDARAELKNLLVDDGKAAIEADFRWHPYRRVRRDSAHRPARPRPVLGRLRHTRRSDQRAARLLPHEPPGGTAHQRVGNPL